MKAQITHLFKQECRSKKVFWPTVVVCMVYSNFPEVLSELHRSQESAYNLRDSARQSHLNRAKLCSKLIKYPHVEDYTVRLLINSLCTLIKFCAPLVGFEGTRPKTALHCPSESFRYSKRLRHPNRYSAQEYQQGMLITVSLVEHADI